MTSHYRGFVITLEHTSLVRTPPDELPAVYLTTHNTHKRQEIHATGGIRTHNLSRPAVADPRLRPLKNEGLIYIKQQSCHLFTPSYGILQSKMKTYRSVWDVQFNNTYHKLSHQGNLNLKRR